MALIQSQNPPKPHKFTNFIGKNYELALNQSIQTLLDSIEMPISDFSVFSSTFYELLQSSINPPLETLWFYSALTFRFSISPKNESFDKFSVIKDLFQSIIGLSASFSSSKSIILIHPVIYELYGAIADLKVKDEDFKTEKKVMREIKSLVDLILGYINVCCCEAVDNVEGSGDSGSLIRPLVDLVRIWNGDQVVGNEGVKEGFRRFFPLLGDDIIEWLSIGSYSVSELAGVVIAEAFLLKLCLEVSEGSPRQVLQKELKTWAVGSMTGFRNFHLFDTLVKMLLEPSLPVTSLLNSEDEIFLREVLYDAVILVEYSFLNPEGVARLPAKHIRSLAVARLMVTHEAIEFYRENGDHTKAISYINAFSCSHLPSHLIKWVTSEIGIDGKDSGPTGSSPKAFLMWLLNLENQGIRLLDNGMPKYRPRVLDNLKADNGHQGYKVEGKKSDADLPFYIDNKGKEEDENEGDGKTNESLSAAFVAAAHTMQLAENGGGRKRKEGKGFEKKKQVKFLKYNLDGNSGSSGERSTFYRKDGSSSESEVENPLSDEDVEVKEQ